MTGNSHQANLIKAEKELLELKKKLANSSNIILDFETTNSDLFNSQVSGIGIALSSKEAYYISAKSLPIQKICQELMPVLQIKQLGGHNVIYDIIIGKRFGFDLNYYYDTKMMFHMLFPDEYQNRLRHIVQRYLPTYKLILIEDLIGSGRKKITIGEVSEERLAEYSNCEVLAIAQLIQYLKDDLYRNDLWKCYIQLNQPLLRILADMTYQGIKLDIPRLLELKEEYEKALKHEQNLIHKIAGKEFNLNSPKQVIEILQDRNVRIPFMTDKGQLSVNEDSLEEIYESTGDVLCYHLLKYRKKMKILSTYLNPFLEQIDDNQRLHSRFHLTVTATGRLASSAPNLQNVPPEIREVFIADSNKMLIIADYSQIELRILAYLSGDKNMLEAFKKNRDIHSETARIFGNKYDEKTARLKSKIVNFSMIYGASVSRIAHELEVDLSVAEKFVQNFYELYPSVSFYQKALFRLARRLGYIRTIGGWKRQFPKINSKNFWERKMAERMVLNTPIQGSASDIIKAAMIDLVKELDKNKMSGKLLLQVHDELVLEVPKDEIHQTKKIIEKSMLKNGFFPAIEPLLKINLDVNKRWVKT